MDRDRDLQYAANLERLVKLLVREADHADDFAIYGFSYALREVATSAQDWAEAIKADHVAESEALLSAEGS